MHLPNLQLQGENPPGVCIGWGYGTRNIFLHMPSLKLQSLKNGKDLCFRRSLRSSSQLGPLKHSFGPWKWLYTCFRHFDTIFLLKFSCQSKRDCSKQLASGSLRKLWLAAGFIWALCQALGPKVEKKSESESRRPLSPRLQKLLETIKNE